MSKKNFRQEKQVLEKFRQVDTKLTQLTQVVYALAQSLATITDAEKSEPASNPGAMLTLTSGTDADKNNQMIFEVGNFIATQKFPRTKNLVCTTHPYKIKNKNIPILDIRILTSEIPLETLKNITSLMAEARAHKIIIRTNVLTDCAGTTCQIAVQGTPGFRIMQENAVNYPLHDPSIVEKPVGFKHIQLTEANQNIIQSWAQNYKKYTKLSDNDLQNIGKTKNTPLTAQECLNYGITDWILTNDGNFINKIIKNEKQR